MPIQKAKSSERNKTYNNPYVKPLLKLNQGHRHGWQMGSPDPTSHQGQFSKYAKSDEKLLGGRGESSEIDLLPK